MADAFAPAEAHYKNQVMAATWGHLAPKKNKIYRGYIVWALGCCGSERLNPTPLYVELQGLDASPWFHNCMIDFLHAHSTEDGAVFRFDGTFRNYKFSGTIRRLKLL